MTGLASRVTGAVLGAADRTLPLSVRRRARYYRMLGRLPSLANPQLFTEKVQWRMVHDRRDLIAGTCDKLRMKEHALAAGVPGLRVPTTCWSGTDVAELSAVPLPERWVLKPNHRFGKVVFGTGRPDVEDLRRRTAGWLDDRQGPRGEWAYSRARRTLLVEEMIGTRPPVDYKFWVFDGEVRLVQVDTDRFGQHRSALLSPTWDLLGSPHRFSTTEAVPRPQRLPEMLDAASRLGRDFDFIRVDLYDVAGQTWFGELTPYPGSGLVALEPRDLDAAMGGHWRLPTVRR
jgi:TupA-like ATPgrasp